MTADIRGNLDRTDDKDACQPALRVGQRQELGWAATFLASPYARFISGHTLVVDGANWQRRSLTNPPVVTVRDQMGKGSVRRLTRRANARERVRGRAGEAVADAAVGLERPVGTPAVVVDELTDHLQVVELVRDVHDMHGSTLIVLQ